MDGRKSVAVLVSVLRRKPLEVPTRGESIEDETTIGTAETVVGTSNERVVGAGVVDVVAAAARGASGVVAELAGAGATDATGVATAVG
jgi:hypothetical protein